MNTIGGGVRPLTVSSGEVMLILTDVNRDPNGPAAMDNFVHWIESVLGYMADMSGVDDRLVLGDVRMFIGPRPNRIEHAPTMRFFDVHILVPYGGLS
jgi:hypothetical protein